MFSQLGVYPFRLFLCEPPPPRPPHLSVALVHFATTRRSDDAHGKATPTAGAVVLLRRADLTVMGKLYLCWQVGEGVGEPRATTIEVRHSSSIFCTLHLGDPRWRAATTHTVRSARLHSGKVAPAYFFFPRSDPRMKWALT